MDPEFWRARWAEGRIGFHEGAPNAFLARRVRWLGERKRVLVPLCGKAEDLAYLAAQGHTVMGIELVAEAARAFFSEHGLTPERIRHGQHEALRAGPITVLVGDFFAVRPQDLGAVDALYDRAAIIALPSELRGPYSRQVRALLAPGSPGLTVTLEYPQAQMEGPPFAVPEAELRTLYAGLELELLEECPFVRARPGAPDVQGVERCFRLQF